MIFRPIKKILGGYFGLQESIPSDYDSELDELIKIIP
jgi:hypothetical protein